MSFRVDGRENACLRKEGLRISRPTGGPMPEYRSDHSDLVLEADRPADASAVPRRGGAQVASRAMKTPEEARGRPGGYIGTGDLVVASSMACPSPPSRRAAKGAAGAVQIAIVDDDDSFRESLGLNLVDEGYAVTGFSCGSAALDYFAAGGRANA